MRSLSEWVMREMQDRLTELRGMTARTYPYPYPPRQEEIGYGHVQSHHGVGSTVPGAYPGVVGVTFLCVHTRPFLFFHSPTSFWVALLGRCMVSASAYVLQRDAL